jgi:CDP-glycerol glycerophosphotransferase
LLEYQADNLKEVPLSRYEDTEALLAVTDILVSDWSSIVFDYLLLKRPTLFLHRDDPFQKGFSCGPEYRFGPVINNIDELIAAIEGACDTADYLLHWKPIMDATAMELYGSYADGHSTERVVKQLDELLQEEN